MRIARARRRIPHPTPTPIAMAVVFLDFGGEFGDEIEVVLVNTVTVACLGSFVVVFEDGVVDAVRTEEVMLESSGPLVDFGGGLEEERPESEV
jgi:hypothetical protein